MPPLLMVALQIGFAALALHMLARHVYPALGHVRQGELVADVWLPVSLVIPLLFLIGGVDGSVREAGWPALGGPVAVAVIGLALAAMIGRGGIGVFGEEFADGESIGWRLAPRLTVAALIAGIILLLLAAAHVMTMWVGQCAFAIAAVMLWINTPEIGRGEPAQNSMQVRAGFAMVVVLMCSFAQGIAGRFAGDDALLLVVALMILHATVALGLAARQTSAGLCVRLGVWSASFGVLFALGLIALLAMVPRILATMFAQELPPHSMQIAAGFGAYAMEATVLMVLTPLAVGVMRLPRGVQVIIGAALLLLVVGRLGWWML
jgi:hypothetical protein